MLLRGEMRPQRRGLVIGIIAGLAWTACKVSIPLLVQAAIDQGIAPRDQQKITEWALIIVGVGVIVRAVHRAAPLPGVPRGALERGRPPAPHVRAPAAAALRLPRPTRRPVS